MKIINKYTLTILTLLVVALLTPAMAMDVYNDELCNNIPRDLGNQTQAMRILSDTEFTFEQSLETLQVFGVKKATFYSCDGTQGYLLVNTNRRNYLYENVPRALWENFKTAYSIDRFFDKNLKYNTFYLY